MTTRRLMLTFPSEQGQEPVIYNLGQQFRVITNIRRANVSEDRGWAVMKREGQDKDIEEGITWLTSKGISVDPIVGDIAEG